MTQVDLSLMCRLCREAGKLFSDDAATDDVKVKGNADFVTKVDMAVQDYMKKALAEHFPDAALLSEESDNEAFVPSQWTFVLDPVDGTTNLIHRYRQSAISLALLLDGQPEAGVVYNPFTDELFSAQKGKGAAKNGVPIHVSRRDDIGDCIVTIGTMPYYKEYAEQNFALFRRVYMDAVDIRRTGSAALDLCYVADGRSDAYFERRLKPWDYAAGEIILQEAGGMITDFSGKTPDPLNPCDILADNGRIHSKMLAYFQ